MPSIPALPLLVLTRHMASFRFPHSHIASIIRSVLAGFSNALLALDDSVSSLPGLSGFTRRRIREVQLLLDILLLVVLEIHDLLTSPSRSGLRSPFPA